MLWLFVLGCLLFSLGCLVFMVVIRWGLVVCWCLSVDSLLYFFCVMLVGFVCFCALW